jgi:hypothetical protein
MRSVRLALGLFLLATAVVAEEYFIPMVGQKQGIDGAWWNTEVWVANTTTSTGGYAVIFLPSGQANIEGLRAEPELEDVPPGATIYRNDLVPQGQTGVLRVLTTSGMSAVGRVYSAAGRGSFGQAVPALTRSAAIRPGDLGQLLGLRRTPQFRTNIGLFNPSTEGGEFRIRLYQASGAVVGEQSYRLAPGGYIQLNDALHAFGITRGEHLRAELSGTVPLLAFASVIDTRSGAPTLVAPVR